MKMLILVLVTSASLGAAVGYGLSAREFSGVAENFVPHNGSVSPVQRGKAPKGSPKLVVTNGQVFNFGSMERYATRRHVFRFRNDGNAPLRLEFDSLSCGMCVKCEITEADVAPTEELEVEVEYSTRKSNPEFSESVRFNSNDPMHPIVELRIEGHVVNSMLVSPEKLYFGDVAPGKGASDEIAIYGFLQQPVEILGHELLDQRTAHLFDVDVRLLSGDEIGEIPNARSGVAVNVRMKPDVALGRIEQTVRLKTNIIDSGTIEIPVSARVVGDISVYGGGIFHEEASLLKFGSVDPSTGADAKLFIRVKGPHREDVKLEIQSIEPAGTAEARLGERKVGTSGTVVLFPLIVEIPPDAKPLIQVGNRTPHATITIRTTHPEAKELPIYVEYSIAE